MEDTPIWDKREERKGFLLRIYGRYCKMGQEGGEERIFIEKELEHEGIRKEKVHKKYKEVKKHKGIKMNIK